MALFTKKNDLDIARAGRDKLKAGLADAETAIAERRATARRLAVDGADDATLDAAEGQVSAAQDRVGNLVAALSEAEQRLAVLERAQAEAVDKTLRQKTASAIEQLASEYEAAIGPYAAAAATLADLSTRASPLIYESRGLQSFFQSSEMEVGAAVAVIAAALRAHAVTVLNGGAAAAMPEIEKPFVPEIPTKLPTTRVFATRAVRWVAGDGTARCSAKYFDIDVPPATAAHALAIGAALPLNHPARKTNYGTWPGHVSLAACFDLDAADTASTAPSQNEPTVHSAFEERIGKS